MAAAKKKPAANATTQAKSTAEKPAASAPANSTTDKPEQTTQAANTGGTETGSTNNAGQQGTQQPEPKAPEAKAPTTKPAETKDTSKEHPTREVLRVRSLAARFRRAGLGFNQKERVLFLDDLSEDQVEALEAEPNLAVKRDVVPVEPDADTGE